MRTAFHATGAGLVHEHATGARIIEVVPSRLSTVPARSRRHIAAVLASFAALFTAVGTVAATQAGTALLQAFVAVTLLVALLLALLAWGFAYSVKVDAAESSVDDAIEQVLAERPGSLCSCGHEHDPTELHFTDAECRHDGTGTDCSRECETCVLAAMRPSPARADGQIRKP
jgi:hypothetical protein